MSEPWVIDDLISVPGHGEFFRLSTDDRKLAKAMGLNTNLRSPFGDASIFKFMKDARNAKVDDIIHKEKFQSDPLADQAATVPLCLKMKQREKEFKACSSMPKCVELIMPAFVDLDGNDIGSQPLRVLSEARVNAT